MPSQRNVIQLFQSFFSFYGGLIFLFERNQIGLNSKCFKCQKRDFFSFTQNRPCIFSRKKLLVQCYIDLWLLNGINLSFLEYIWRDVIRQYNCHINEYLWHIPLNKNNCLLKANNLWNSKFYNFDHVKSQNGTYLAKMGKRPSTLFPCWKVSDKLPENR